MPESDDRVNLRRRWDDLSVGIRPAMTQARRAGAYANQRDFPEKSDRSGMLRPARSDVDSRFWVILARSLSVLEVLGKLLLKILIPVGFVVAMICWAVVLGAFSVLLGSDTAQARAGARRRKWL